jgi:hypothetical protein
MKSKERSCSGSKIENVNTKRGSVKVIINRIRQKKGGVPKSAELNEEQFMATPPNNTI